MRSKLAALLLATLAAGSGACALTAVALPASASSTSSSASETQTSQRKWINSEAGWQRSGLYVEPGDLVRVYSMGGRWTVDHREFPYVSARGYPWGLDREIQQGCKVLGNHTYGTLIGKINGTAFKIGKGAIFRVEEEGFLELRINDADRCLGDNDGAIRVKATIIDED